MLNNLKFFCDLFINFLDFHQRCYEVSLPLEKNCFRWEKISFLRLPQRFHSQVRDYGSTFHSQSRNSKQMYRTSINTQYRLLPTQREEARLNPLCSTRQRALQVKPTVALFDICTPQFETEHETLPADATEMKTPLALFCLKALFIFIYGLFIQLKYLGWCLSQYFEVYTPQNAYQEQIRPRVFYTHLHQWIATLISKNKSKSVDCFFLLRKLIYFNLIFI